MDNDVLKLIKMITLLYLCGESESKKDHICNEIRSMVTHIKVDPRAIQGIGSNENAIEGLRDTVEWMLHMFGTKFDMEELVSRLRVNCRDNPEHMEMVEKILRVEIDPSKLDARINFIVSELRFLAKKDKVRKIVQRANATLCFSNEYLDLNPFLDEIISELSEANANTSVEELPGLIGMVDFGDTNQIKEALNKAVTTRSIDGMLNTGLTGLNDALGGLGLIRGWMYNIGAISFGYKTGSLLDLSLNVPRFNKPWLVNPLKIPLIVRISVETTIDQDTKILYQRAWWQKTGTKIRLKDIDLDEASDYLKTVFESQGYKFKLLHFNSNTFSVFDLIKVLDYFESLGYEIHMCVFDYATKIAKHTPAPREDLKLPLTYDLARCYCYPRGILFATAAQLNSDARKIAMENSSGCTRVFAKGSFYENAKSIYNELDVELLSHVHKHVDGKSYWTASVGKHRDHDDTPLSKRDFYYPFTPGGIMPDVGKDPGVIYKLPNALSPESLNMWED